MFFKRISLLVLLFLCVQIGFALGAVQDNVIIPYSADKYGWRQTNELSITQGEKFVLGPQASVGGNRWHWTGPNGFTSNNREFTINNASTAQGGTYTVTFTANNGQTSTATFNIRVLASKAPAIKPYVWNGTWREGSTLTIASGSKFSAGPQETNGYNNRGTWRWTGPNNFTSNNREFTINNAYKAQAGTYQVTFTDEYGRREMMDFQITVQDNAAPVNPTPAPSENFADEINNKTYSDGQHVIYELNVGSFTNEGTFRAAQARLSELKRLGVDIVWIIPIYPRDGGLNSPYSATNFKAVNPAYGTIADLRNYVSAAHALNMQVWLDWVPNHTSTQNVWVTEHPDYYTRDGQGNMVHPGSGPIIYNDVYQLNYNNPALQNAMNDCLKFWIDQADVDGFRCDMVSSDKIPSSYWQNAIPTIKNYKRGKKISFLGEGDFSDNGQARLRNVGFDYDYAWYLQETVFQNYFGASANGASLRDNSRDFVNASKNLGVGRMLYITNHDQNWNTEKKTLSQKYGDNKYLLKVLSYTLWGMPLIYNGEETGGEQALNYFQDTKINWNQNDSKMKNTLRVLGALKHSQAALHDGKNAADNADVNFLQTTNNNSSIVAFSRRSGNSQVIVILNTATSAQTASINGINGVYSQWLNSGTIANGISRKDYTFNGNLSVNVPAKGYMVYVNDNYSDNNNDGQNVINNLTDDSNCAIFYESDANNADVHAWMWNGNGDGNEYTASGNQGWPGDKFSEIGKTQGGRYIYKLVVNLRNGQNLPTNVIITENGNDDNAKTVEAAFVNHGYYVKWNNVATRTVPTATATTDITPYVHDKYGWRQQNTLSVTVGEQFAIGPQAKTAGSWYWTGPNGFTSNNREITLNNVSVAQDGTYTVTFTANNGARATAQFAIHIYTWDAPAITPYVLDQQGWHQNTTLNIADGTRWAIGPQESRGYDNGNGRWSWTGPNGFTSNNREINFQSAATNQAGTYTVTFTDQNGRRAVQDFRITINGVARAKSNNFADSAVTGINEVKADEKPQVIYDLQGRRVTSPRAGQIYIVNGRKVVNRK